MKEPVLYKAVRGPLATFFKAVYKPQIIGKENIPESGKIILAGNHTNYLDCLLVGSSTKRCVHYLAKDELVKGPFGFIFKAMGIIPVNRRTKDQNALATAVETLNDEKLIGIFPEGTINRTKDVIMPFKFGAVKMSLVSQADIVPFVISGKYKPFKKNIKIRFFEPLKAEEDLEKANERLMKIVSDEIVKEKEANEKK